MFFTCISMDVFRQNSYSDMCSIQNKKFYCKCKALKLDVPLSLKHQVEGDTLFGRVGQHHFRRRIMNVRGKR